MTESIGEFDLNMEEVLEAWGVPDGIREVIANALDEESLTETDSIEIFEEDGRWHVRDYGRGLRYEHLTQNEDQEKLNNPDKVIGKFGVGLKDALATLYRHGVNVTIHSKHNTFKIKKSPKHGFEDIETLHVEVNESEREIEGTDVVFDGVSKKDIEEAKQNFLQFSDEELLEETDLGEVYRSPQGRSAFIYVNGLKVAKEENFLFSYNITKTTKKVRDALNRERSNVGRTAYSERIKDILKKCTSQKVAEQLVDDLERFEVGETHDELTWKDVRIHACKLLNPEEVLFISPEDERRNSSLVSSAKSDGYKVVTVPQSIRDELSGEKDIEGNQIRDLDRYHDEYRSSFSYKWVEPNELTDEERKVWDLHERILGMVDGVEVDDILISETMRINIETDERVRGQWSQAENRVIVKREVLSSRSDFASVLLHELAHARTFGAADLSQEFEDELTKMLGEVACTKLDKGK